MEERAMLLDELVAAGVDPSRMMPGTGCCSITVSVVDRQFRANAAIVSFFDIDLKFFRAES
jgi:hypothetical protein